MASKTQRERVLTGGLQLIDPGDKLNPGSSLIAQNLRPDVGDQLISRNGVEKTAGPIGSGVFHTLKTSDSFGFLAGIGPALYGPGADLASTIDAGYDGEPLGVSYAQGSIWIMNRARQSRILGSLQRERWGVLAPATAPTATGGGQLSTLVHEFDDTGGISVGIASPPNGADPYTDYALKDGSVTANPELVTADIDTDNFRSGAGSLRIVSPGTNSVTAYASLGGVDLRVDGKDQDGDVIRVWVFCSDASQLSAVTVYVRTGARTDPDHGYAEYSFSTRFLNQALNSWTQLKIQRRLNLDDWSQRLSVAADAGIQQTISDLEAQFATAIQSPTFVYTGTGWPQTGIGAPPPASYPPSKEMLNLDWSNISEFGITFSVASGNPQVGVDRAEVIGTVGENSSGAIQYFVSFENEDQQDGNPSPASNSVIAGNQTITLTNVPISPDSNTISRRIYRIGGGLSQAYLVGRLWGNASSGPFVDLTTNAQAQADNIVMPADHDLPPPARGVIGPVFGKLIAYASDEHPARYWWTPSGRTWYFPGALDDFEGNWEDAGGDNERILTATDHKQMVLFYKKRSIWRLAGDPVSTDPVKTNSQVGAVGEKAVWNGGAVDYFIGWEGVYSFNGDFETKISDAIDPIFKGRFVRINDGETIEPINVSALSKACISVIGDRLRISYASASSSVNNSVLICHLPTGRWMTESYPFNEAGFDIMLYEGPGGALWAGQTGGYMYGLEGGGRIDDTAPIHVIWHSRYLDQALPDCNKVYTEIEIDFQTIYGNFPNAPLNIWIVLENGLGVFVGTVESSDGTHPRKTTRLTVYALNGQDIGRTAKNAAVRIEGDTYGQLTIFGVYLHWYPEERVATSFDTGPTNCGIPERVKEVDYVEFFMTGSGQSIQKAISSDLPGGLLIHRDTGALTAPNGRGTLRTRLTAPIDGRNFRMWLALGGAGEFQVHQARARMRVIGEYIDGTIGEYFESPEFSIAPNRVGELKDLLLDYDSTGPASLLIYSDLPGNALAVQRTIALPQQSRAPRMLPFETPTLSAAGGGSTLLPYGQLFKVRIVPAPGSVVRLHGRATLRARIIGCYFDGTRGEIWETQALDLFGGMAIFREVSIVTQAEGSLYLEFRTELPGQDIRTVASYTINPSATTPGRLPFIGRLPGSTKGRLQQLRLVGPYVARVLEAKVYGRRVQGNDTPWDWIPIPVEPTPDEWAEIAIPVRSTPEAFDWVEIPVDEIA